MFCSVSENPYSRIFFAMTKLQSPGKKNDVNKCYLNEAKLALERRENSVAYYLGDLKFLLIIKNLPRRMSLIGV